MKKTTIIVTALLIMGTAASAQEKKADKPKPNPPKVEGHYGLATTASKTAGVTPTKQKSAIITSQSNIPHHPPAKVTTATDASTGKATGK